MADEIKTMQNMTPSARAKEISLSQARVQELRFSSRTGRLKGVRELREARRHLARLLTVENASSK